MDKPRHPMVIRPWKLDHSRQPVRNVPTVKGDWRGRRAPVQPQAPSPPKNRGTEPHS